MNPTESSVDMDKAMQFAFKVVGDMGAALSGALAYIGDKTGLFKILAEKPLTLEELAAKTSFQKRYLKEWASAMVAAEFIDYDAKNQTFFLPLEKALVLAKEDSPFFVQGGIQMLPDHYAKIPGILKHMKEGGGIPYSEYGHDTFEGTERFFKPGYLNFLVQQWIPATGYEEELKKGAKVADVGCGRGWAILTLAKAYPNSKFYGFDNHAPNVEAARELAKKEGVEKNAFFEARGSTELPQTKDFSLICNFDSLHDMTDPEGCARSVLGALKKEGAWLILEPNVADRLEENINPVARVFYSISLLQCMTVSLAHGGKGYGACMGPSKLSEIVKAGGFTRHERLPLDNPFNFITLSRP